MFVLVKLAISFLLFKSIKFSDFDEMISIKSVLESNANIIDDIKLLEYG